MTRCIQRLLIPTLFLSLWATSVFAANCLDCHERESFEGRVIHAPLKDGDCQICHNPHATPHKGLLLKSQKELCFECHQSLKRQIESRKLSHEPVERGECTVCHAPHAANYRNLLSGSLVESCAVCHDELQDQFANKHAPYAKGQCNSCHDPHAADDYRLLNKSTPGLCLDCHKQQERLKKKHMGRSPQTMDCLTCHNPHGGEQRALLRKVQHEPFANGDCRVCHSGNQTGIEVCTQCHDDVLTSFNHTSNHFLGAGQENLCTRCHTPHASNGPGLLPGSAGSVCRNCHADTFERRQTMLHRHQNWDECSDCHALHGSDYPAMLKAEPDKVCSGCHENHTTFTHPLGEQAIDPRNMRPMNCVTCHDPNVGTMFQYFLRGSGERGLCVECHQSY
jgi:predicted CXXCH cytochrome family protein